MCTLKEIKCSLSNVSTNLKVTAVETALEQTIINLRDLANDYEQLRLNCKDYETQYLAQKEKCESKTCSGSLELKKVNQTKDNTIQAIASALTKLYETRDFNTISEIFNIICRESTPDNKYNEKHNAELTTVSNCDIPEDIKKDKILDQDESVSEIEGTPTGRKSPIILTKKPRNVTNVSTSREKKKCSGDWCTPEKKVLKLSFPTPNKTPNGRLKQSRLNLVKVKTTSVVDLTSSPEIKTENMTTPCYVKQEELDDETILPSPGLVNFQALQKSLKSSPSKFKKPLSLKLKMENSKANVQKENIADLKEIDRAQDYPESYKFDLPTKKEAEHLESKADESMSLLRHIGTFAAKPDGREIPSSPSKRPLVENTSAENIRNQLNAESSMSILNHPPTDHLKRQKNVEPVYKEPTVRKKSEKRALPGWSCKECKTFYDELYRDNPEMLARKMDECSRHRGRRDPVRPRTPPGFWDPRWDVPDDTEEFNRRNNAI